MIIYFPIREDGDFFLKGYCEISFYYSMIEKEKRGE